MSDENTIAIAVCRLITLQRGIVEAARNIDEELKNGDLHEEKFSSGEFLKYIDIALKHNNKSPSARLVNSESYILNSFNRVLDVAIEYHAGLAQRALTELSASNIDDLSAEDDGIVTNGREIRDKIDSSIRKIQLLKTSLAPVSDDHFTDQVENGLVAIADLIKGTHAARFQIKRAQDRENERREKQRAIDAARISRWQNRWMIVWGFAAFVAASIGLLYSFYPNIFKW